MNPSSNATSSHHAWRRRLRRRYLPGVFLSDAVPWGLKLVIVVPCLASVIGQLGIVAWMEREQRWGAFAAFARWVWFFNCVLAAVSSAFVSLIGLWAKTILTRRQIFSWVMVPLAYGAAALSLSMGRLDWAVALVYGRSAVNSVQRAWDWGLWRLSLPYAILSLGVVAACFGGSSGLAAVCLFLPWVPPFFLKPTLREMIINKPTRREFIQKIREQSKSAKGRQPFTLIKGLLKAEMWDEALEELGLQTWPEHGNWNRPRMEARWKAEIYLGRGRYDDVLRLHGGDKQADSPLATYLAVAHAKLGHRELARRIAHGAKRHNRQDAERAMGDVLWEAGEHERALECYEKAMMGYETMRAMGKSLMALGDYAEARVCLQQAIRYTDWVRAEDLHRLGECLRHLGEERATVEAEQLARKYAEPAPDGKSSVPVTA